MKRSIWGILSFGLLLGQGLNAASLTPSRAAFERQVAGAEAHGYRRAQTSDDVYSSVRSGALVRLTSNGNYEVKATVPLPFARPEIGQFMNRLGAEHLEACGDTLVITSLVRPKGRQPRNAHPRSVHQLGMALDLRRSWSRTCRGWLEANLLHLEKQGILEASRENNPPHYHVVLFSDPFREYVGKLESETSRLASGSLSGKDSVEIGYVVQQGDSLWRIASRHGVDVSSLRIANSLYSNTIRPGQLLRVPVATSTGSSR